MGQFNKFISSVLKFKYGPEREVSHSVVFPFLLSLSSIFLDISLTFPQHRHTCLCKSPDWNHMQLSAQFKIFIVTFVCFHYLLLYNKQPQNLWLKTKAILFAHDSMHQEFRLDLTRWSFCFIRHWLGSRMELHSTGRLAEAGVQDVFSHLSTGLSPAELWDLLYDSWLIN